MLLAGPVSHTGFQYIDFVEIFSVSLDLSTIYFALFSGCWASFLSGSCSILECCNLFSGLKLSIRSFCFIPVMRLLCPAELKLSIDRSAPDILLWKIV